MKKLTNPQIIKLLQEELQNRGYDTYGEDADAISAQCQFYLEGDGDENEPVTIEDDRRLLLALQTLLPV